MNTYAEALRLYQEGQYEEAARRLRIVVEFDRQNHQALLYYGAALGQLGRWQQAVDAYRAVTQLQPEDPTAFCELASALIELGHWDQADDALTTALLLEPNHPVALGLRERVRDHFGQADADDLARTPTKEPAGTMVMPGATPRRRVKRVTVLWCVLAVLLVVVGVRTLRRPGERWRRLTETERLLDQIDTEHRRLAKVPGEDFKSMDRIRRLRDGAERRLVALDKAMPGLPEVHVLRARLIWERDHDALATKSQALEALAQLRAAPGTGRRPSGYTAAQWQARAYLVLAQVDLSTARATRTPDAWQRARGWLERARQLDPEVVSADLDAAFQPPAAMPKR